MRTGSWVGLAFIVLILVAALAVLLGAVGTTSSGEASEGRLLTLEEDAARSPFERGEVMAKYVGGGVGLFGLNFVAAKNKLVIGFAVPASCEDSIPQIGDMIVLDGACFDEAFEERVTGSGAAFDGSQPLVVVELDVSRDCYEATAVGNPWMPVADVCAR